MHRCVEGEIMAKINVLIWLSMIGLLLLLSIVFGLILFIVGVQGIWLPIVFSFAAIGIQWYLGPIIVKFVSGAREVSENEAPELHKMIEELAAHAGIPKPKVCIVPNRTPNAFAFGRTQGDSYVAVHTGLLQMLNKDEVRGVLAHEIGHIKHRDVTIITMASVLPVVLYWGTIIAFGRNDDRSPLAVWLGAVLAQFVGQLAVLWLSREREFAADAYAKEATRSPLPLARALVKISYTLSATNTEASPSMKAFYIGEADEIPPEILEAIGSGDSKRLKEAIEHDDRTGILELFSTHPRTSKRLKALLK